MTPLESLTKKLHALLPELTELSFGCRVKVNEPVLENLRKSDKRAGFAKNTWIISDMEAECVKLKNAYDTGLDIGSWIGLGLIELIGHPIGLEHVLKALQKQIKIIRAQLPKEEDKSDSENAAMFMLWDRLRYWWSYLHTDPNTPWKLGHTLENQSQKLIKVLDNLIPEQK